MTSSAAQPGVTAYLCTSASFVSGLDGEARLRAAMEAAGARQAITTSGALLAALRAVGATRVAVGTPDDAALTGPPRRVSRRGRGRHSRNGPPRHGRRTSGASSSLTVRDLARSLPLDGAEAVFLACTNLPTYDVLPALEAELGLPVLSANLVTMWAALRGLGLLPEGRPERLFAAR